MLQNTIVECGPVTLDGDGYFEKDGNRIFPFGVNYWPAKSGLRMWESWDSEEIESDLQRMQDTGFNAFRFFLRWQDFEPHPGDYSDLNFERLDWLLKNCQRYGLMPQCSLFIGWMSGGVFWPEWKGERNFFSDPFLLERGVAFARRAAEALLPYRNELLCVDLGNELACLDDAKVSTREEIELWCSKITDSVRSVLSDVLITSGLDMGQVTKDEPFSFNNQPGTDFYTIHNYPVPNWSSVPMGGLSDPLSRSLFAFYCAYARAYGPVFLQEFGTFITAGKEKPANFLREVLPAVTEVGSNGLFWWCLNDISSMKHPYALCEQERNLGVFDLDYQMKPSLGEAIETMRGWAKSPDTLPKVDCHDLAFYIPNHIGPVGREFTGVTNTQSTLGKRYLVGWNLVGELGLKAKFVCSDAVPAVDEGVVLCAAKTLHRDELEKLLDWVANGGKLVIHGLCCNNWGTEMAKMLGAYVSDYMMDLQIEVSFGGQEWVFPADGQHSRFVLTPTTAEVLATDAEGNPALLRNRHGQGQIIFSPLSPEDAACVHRAKGAAHGDRWSAWYSSLLNLN